MTNFDRTPLLHQFEGDTYLHSLNVLPQVGLVTTAGPKPF
jgi:hypothetical protein